MPKLPVADLSSLTISGSAPQLAFFLVPIDSEEIRMRLGREKVKRIVGPLEVVEGQVFKNRSENIRGMRYLYRDEQGDLVGVANITRIGRQAILSNLFVRPDKRKSGIATLLVDAAKADFPRLRADTNMTEMGAEFLGYTRDMVLAQKTRETVLKLVSDSGKRVEPKA